MTDFTLILQGKKKILCQKKKKKIVKKKKKKFSEGFTDGSNPKNWLDLNKWSLENKLIFIPSVGPGYNDEQIRPWNSKNTKDRLNGDYYKKIFEAIINFSPSFVSITSFNEYHEVQKKFIL